VNSKKHPQGGNHYTPESDILPLPHQRGKSSLEGCLELDLPAWIFRVFKRNAWGRGDNNKNPEEMAILDEEKRELLKKIENVFMKGVVFRWIPITKRKTGS